MRREFERVTPESVGIPSGAIMRLLDALESGFTEMHGLMIMRHGKVCAEGWWAPYAPGLRHSLQSLSKTYAATAVGIAYTQGLLRLDERVIDIFPELAPSEPSENLKLLSVRDVLCMGCGMDEMPMPTENWIRDFLAMPVNHAPGSTFMYNSTGSTLLAAIVRQKTGRTMQSFLTEHLYEKIGIDPCATGWSCMPDGTEVGGGGMLSTTENNLRLMKLYADGGVWDGERILAEDYVRLATSVQNESATEAKVNPTATDNFLGYGFQIWMCKHPGAYRADGAMGQFSIVVPDMDMIISLNETGNGPVDPQTTLNEIWEFLDEIGGAEVLPEQQDECAALYQRMKSLSLAAPIFAPHNALADQVSGRWYAVKQGRMSFGFDRVSWMSGAQLKPGVERFKLDFEGYTCCVTIVADGAERVLSVAMDGTRRENVMHDNAQPVEKLLLSGFWRDDNAFVLAARWIETCFEDQYVFAFDEHTVTVTQEATIGGFGPAANGEPVCAELV